MTTTIRTNDYIETASTDVLLERIEHMRKLLQDKDKEIKSLKETVSNYERVIGSKFKNVSYQSIGPASNL